MCVFFKCYVHVTNCSQVCCRSLELSCDVSSNGPYHTMDNSDHCIVSTDYFFKQHIHCRHLFIYGTIKLYQCEVL